MWIKIIFFLLFIFSIGCEKVEEIFREEDLLKRPDAKRCADCHKAIYDQWKKSRHSLSYKSETFKEKTENYRKIKCLNCHIPYEIRPLEEPKKRSDKLHDGINCVSCHFREETNAMHGGYKVFSPPHPSKQDLDYKKSKICGGCHKKTYDQWLNSRSNKQCQECHMPAKKGSLIQKFPFQYFHLPKDVHDHSFPVPTPDQKDFDIKIDFDGMILTVYLKNKKIPHSVPTADNGNPIYYVTLKIFKDNKLINEDSHMITSKDPLIYNKEKSYEFYVFEEFDTVEVILERRLSWETEVRRILRKRFSL
ncbi:multiheme c-type cytochrome [Persephonella sp.]